MKSRSSRGSTSFLLTDRSSPSSLEDIDKAKGKHGESPVNEYTRSDHDESPSKLNKSGESPLQQNHGGDLQRFGGDRGHLTAL